MNAPIRRTDRRLDDAAAMALLKRGEYGILSTSDKHNQPYGIPVNYVVMEGSIFFHCATEGQKLENITASLRRLKEFQSDGQTRYEALVQEIRAKRERRENGQ